MHRVEHDRIRNEHTRNYFEVADIIDIVHLRQFRWLASPTPSWSLVYFDLLHLEELLCMQLAVQTKVSQVGGVLATGHLQIREVGLH
jgi:hypothetical protein